MLAYTTFDYSSTSRATSHCVARALSKALNVSSEFEMNFKIKGKIRREETFATGTCIREIARLRRIYGNGRWRKRKGVATIEFSDGTTHRAELHWYEATGIGRKEYKIKQLME